VLFSIAFFCQQSGSGLIMTLPADIFPLSAVGSVSGLIGFGGAIGGAVFGVVVGFLLGQGFGYGTLFFYRWDLSSHWVSSHPVAGRQGATT
jgi:MFS transporter, ACS family, hexuronate transporter